MAKYCAFNKERICNNRCCAFYRNPEFNEVICQRMGEPIVFEIDKKKKKKK